MQDRFVPGSVKNIQESLQWLGLNIDEGPSVGGSHGPYMQVSHMSMSALSSTMGTGIWLCAT